MIDVTIRINDSDGPLTAVELAVLRALGGETFEGAPVTQAEPTTKPAAAAKAAPAPAKKATPAKAAPAPAPAAAEPAEELDADAKMELAVTRATAFINDGNADKLRAVLGAIGVKRVSELEGAQLDQFLADTE